jgi:hypothetical protein
MLFDLTFPCYLAIFSGKKCLSGKVICAFNGPLIVEGLEGLEGLLKISFWHLLQAFVSSITIVH